MARDRPQVARHRVAGVREAAAPGEVLELVHEARAQAAGVGLLDVICVDNCQACARFGGDDLRTAFVTLSGTGRIVAFEWPRPGLRLAF